MKKRYLTLGVLVFWVLVARAQAYRPFDFETAKWRLGKQAGPTWGASPIFWVTAYQVKGIRDTILPATGKKYKIMEEQKYEAYYDFANSNGFQYARNSFYSIGAVREENKVIYFTKNYQAEDTLYNFNNMYIGKRIYNTPFQEMQGDYLYVDSLVVIDMDSIILSNGSSRKRYKIQSYVRPGLSMKYSREQYIIEGIGSQSGLLPLYVETIDFGIGLVCFSENNQWLMGLDCEMPIISNQLIFDETKKFQIYPNPSTDKIYIIGNDYTTTNIRFFDISGKNVLNSSFQQPAVEVNIEKLPKGMYFLHIETETGREVHKVLKNE